MIHLNDLRRLSEQYENNPLRDDSSDGICDYGREIHILTPELEEMLKEAYCRSAKTPEEYAVKVREFEDEYIKSLDSADKIQVEIEKYLEAYEQEIDGKILEAEDIVAAYNAHINGQVKRLLRLCKQMDSHYKGKWSIPDKDGLSERLRLCLHKKYDIMVSTYERRCQNGKRATST